MSCNQENKAEAIGDNNPLLAAYDTPYEAPPFHLIKNEHYKPALLEGIRLHQKEADAIAADPAAPTFENTVLALENSGRVLNRINTTFHSP